MDLLKSMEVSASGMKVQGTRLRVVSENIANAGSTAEAPEDEPYRRKLVTFGAELDRAQGIERATVRRILPDPAEFIRRYQPGHPAADGEGYVRLANVNTLVEMADLREAQRSYQANIKAIEASRAMLRQTIDLLR